METMFSQLLRDLFENAKSGALSWGACIFGSDIEILLPRTELEPYGCQPRNSWEGIFWLACVNLRLRFYFSAKFVVSS